MEIQIETIEAQEFYPSLRATVEERIEELTGRVKLFEKIFKSRDLHDYEEHRFKMAGIALTTNENFMLLFDKDYLILQ